MNTIPPKNGRPRIGVYATGNGIGGHWRYVDSLLEGVDLDEFEIVVFSHLTGGYEKRPGVRVVNLDGGGATPSAKRATYTPPGRDRLSRQLYSFTPPFVKLWAGFYRDVIRLARGFRGWDIDLFHTNHTGCEESALAARLAGIPHVLGTFHVDSTYDLQKQRNGPSHRLLEQLSCCCLNRAIGVSHATSRDWIRRTHIPAGRVMTIHNGIDPDRYRRRRARTEARASLGLPSDGVLIIGGVGRLDEAKGFPYLLDAVSQLSAEHPGLRLVLAGQGPLRGPLADQAARLGIADRVKFLGFCPDVQAVFDALDIFVLSSLCEALPYALLEAMATELPVVATTVGGVSEVVIPDETGCLVPPRNADALAAALRPLVTSEEMRQRLGRAARDRVAKHFREDDMVRRTVAAYRGMLSNLRGAGSITKVRPSGIDGWLGRCSPSAVGTTSPNTRVLA